ncbi:MAG: hypothetical protein K1X89_12570 [Myxococcaceae bacterium]|nr:hypothetical protein [Myxococcaceae bacterium]
MLAALALAALTALGPTHELHGKRFTVVTTERAERAAEKLLPELEKARDDVEKTLGRDWDGVTEVRVGADRDEARELSPGGEAMPTWAEALAWPELNVVLVPSPTLAKTDAYLTLRHELVHVALGRLAHGWPRWFQEGLAQQLTQENRFSFQRFETLSRAVTQDRVFPLEDLATRFPERADDVAIAYAQSASFVGFLFERHGPQGFARLTDELRTGVPFEQAFARALHTSITAEERVWRLELPGRFPAWVAVVMSDALWGAIALIVVLAWWRRRRAILAWRTEQERAEQLEDLALAAALPPGTPPYWALPTEPQPPPPPTTLLH